MTRQAWVRMNGPISCVVDGILTNQKINFDFRICFEMIDHRLSRSLLSYNGNFISIRLLIDRILHHEGFHLV